MNRKIGEKYFIKEWGKDFFEGPFLYDGTEESEDYIEFYENEGSEVKFESDLKNEKLIIIPEGITEICKEEFAGFENLEKIILPTTIKVIGEKAFSGCKNLKEININSDVLIGQMAFENTSINVKNKKHLLFCCNGRANTGDKYTIFFERKNKKILKEKFNLTGDEIYTFSGTKEECENISSLIKKIKEEIKADVWLCIHKPQRKRGSYPFQRSFE